MRVDMRDIDEDGPCDHPDCGEPGKFRAPVSPRRPGEFHRFCLKHVREYNAAWNYCAGMDRHAVEAQIRDDIVWNRPTWPLGDRPPRAELFRDPFDALGRNAPPVATPTAERRALATLGLEPPVSRGEVSQRYRLLAKKLHPDANGGDKRAEERLKSVNHAYATLRNIGRLG